MVVAICMESNPLQDFFQIENVMESQPNARPLPKTQKAPGFHRGLKDALSRS